MQYTRRVERWNGNSWTPVPSFDVDVIRPPYLQALTVAFSDGIHMTICSINTWSDNVWVLALVQMYRWCTDVQICTSVHLYMMYRSVHLYRCTVQMIPVHKGALFTWFAQVSTPKKCVGTSQFWFSRCVVLLRTVKICWPLLRRTCLSVFGRMRFSHCNYTFSVVLLYCSFTVVSHFNFKVPLKVSEKRFRDLEMESVDEQFTFSDTV